MYSFNLCRVHLYREVHESLQTDQACGAGDAYRGWRVVGICTVSLLTAF